MPDTGRAKFGEIVASHEKEILSEWVSLQLGESATGRRGFDERQIREQAREFMAGFTAAVQSGDRRSIAGSEWQPVKNVLESVSAARLSYGATPSEVVGFVFSLKQPLFARIRKEFGSDAESIALETWTASVLLDQLGLYTTEIYQKSRNEIIQRQGEEMMELSTPVVVLWEGVLAVPLIGTLDSARTQVVMQNLLQAIVDTSAAIAIIDITGVPTVDTLVAQHLLKTIAAARLMGADCIISGIRPQIAQTIIHLGVDLTNVVTKATLADAFSIALRRIGAKIVRSTDIDANPEVG
jgi:rsbT co-antagonist protein RsbR